MEINNLKRAAEINTQIEAIKNTQDKLKDVFCAGSEGTNSEIFDLTEIGTGTCLDLTACLVSGEIHEAVERVLSNKYDKLVEEAKAL